ncbi:MAG TPA: 1-acyl-sn-glycerol-3-phosphate acyltransferase [Gemmatales bacterium]|nr:1-acyl-sn-glycerol-3-phosphate acyltransferase [Gemmatales bacterium]HMP16674.1 1-acyl-sn-glycerol-3-phosphate acyltransferase [Gemmatales bacterium]
MQKDWQDNRTVSPLPFFVGIIALLLFTWLWIDVNYVWHYLSPLNGSPPRDELLRTRPMTAVILGYMLIGATAAFLLQPHPWRALGLLPWAGIFLWILMIIGLVVDYSPSLGRPLFAITAGVLWYVPFATAMRRLSHVSIMEGIRKPLDWAAAALMGGLCLLLYGWSDYNHKISELLRRSDRLTTPENPFPVMSMQAYQALWDGVQTRAWVMFVIATVVVLFWIYLFRREMLEAFLELFFLPIYRFKLCGPGVGHFPAYGPVLVIANHASWFDPVWIGKVLPRQITPMMTSVFFDRPGLKFLVKDIFGSIRVADVARRRETPPELGEAVERLKNGECVLLFPEGRLRREEHELLKHFGQGVWHILKERPKTPVVPMWIEGGWGSYASYGGGTEPTVNKGVWFDWNRKITLVLGEPIILDPPLLQQHQSTRKYLMDCVLALRKFLPRNHQKLLNNQASAAPSLPA